MCGDCEFGNLCENFISANRVKRHIYHVINSRLWHDLPTSVNDRVISPFREGFNFTKLRYSEVLRKQTLAIISKFTALVL